MIVGVRVASLCTVSHMPPRSPLTCVRLPSATSMEPKSTSPKASVGTVTETNSERWEHSQPVKALPSVPLYTLVTQPSVVHCRFSSSQYRHSSVSLHAGSLFSRPLSCERASGCPVHLVFASALSASGTVSCIGSFRFSTTTCSHTRVQGGLSSRDGCACAGHEPPCLACNAGPHARHACLPFCTSEKEI